MDKENETLVFISHTNSDKAFANKLEKILKDMSVDAWNFSTGVAEGDNYLEKAREPLENCSHILVLIGPNTQESQWVDMEMQIATAARNSKPGAYPIGVILEDHKDFERPYYDPKRVPFRLHDMVLREAGTVKKWTTDEAEIRTWLEASARHRSTSRRPPRPSLSVLEFVREKSWTDEGDIPRTGLESLSAKHPGR